MAITARDLEYLDNRLMAPAAGASEAYERLRLLGMRDEAAHLMAAMQEFQDRCREVRGAVRDKAGH